MFLQVGSATWNLHVLMSVAFAMGKTIRRQWIAPGLTSGLTPRLSLFPRVFNVESEPLVWALTLQGLVETIRLL